MNVTLDRPTRVARALAIGLALAAAALMLAAPFALRHHQEGQGCERLAPSTVAGLDYHDGAWWSPGDGETYAYSVTEDSTLWSLPRCGPR